MKHRRRPHFLRVGGTAPRLKSALQVLAFLPIVIGGAYVFFYLPPAPAIAVINATSEAMSFDVGVPDMAQLRLQGFAVTFENAAASMNLGFRDGQASQASRRPLCLTGIIRPEQGTKVTYRRYAEGAPSIVLERADGRPAANFQVTKGDAPAALRQSSWIRLEGQSGDEDEKKPCEGSPQTRLPIYGVASLGTELRPTGAGEEEASGLLLEGTLDIFARTIELSNWSDEAPRIYPASTTSISIPPGSRLFEYVTGAQAKQPWVGFVQTDADKALDVKITTPAMKLAILRPGVGMTPEVIAIGLFTQLSNDPTLISIQVAAALLFSAFQMLSSFVSIFNRPRTSENAKNAIDRAHVDQT